MNWQTLAVAGPVVLIAIGSLTVVWLIWKGSKMAMVGKAYRATFVLIAVGIGVIAIAVTVANWL